MIDHILFDKHKYISDVQVINGLVDMKLVGKTITSNNYTIYWANIVNARIVNSPTTNIPDDVDTDSIGKTGEITDLKLDSQHTTYFVVDFHDTIDGIEDGAHISFVKASDVMKRAVSGKSL